MQAYKNMKCQLIIGSLACLAVACSAVPEPFKVTDTDTENIVDSSNDSEAGENSPSLCRDGKDNDGDKLVDCEDDDCNVFVVCSDPSTDEKTTDDTETGHADGDSDSDSDNDTDVDTDADGDSDGDGDGDGDVDGDTDVDTDTDVDGDADGDVDGDTDVDTDTDTDIDTDTNLEAGQDKALRVNTAPLIDGVLSESTWHLNTLMQKTISGQTANRARFDVMWDAKNLYIGVIVVDNNLCIGTDMASWNYDSVEIFIDPNNSKGTAYDAKDVQMIFKYVDENWVEYGAKTTNEAPVTMRGAKTTNGYGIEVAVPWSGLGISPTDGMTVGFDLGVNDDDETCGSRDAVMRWWGDENNYMNTSNFGELILYNEPADPIDTDTGTDTGTDTADSETDTPTEDTEKETPVLESLRTAVPPTIDGVIDEPIWQSPETANRVVSEKTDNTALFYTLWDTENLYVAIEVNDPRVCTKEGVASWECDSAEIYLDPNNSKSTAYDGWDAQFIFKYTDTDTFEHGASTTNYADATVRGARSATGYTIEVAVPWTGLNVLAAGGKILGFDIGVNDDDGECGSRDGELRWAGDAQNFESTAAFGNLLLSPEYVVVEVDTETDVDAGPGTDSAQ